MIRITAGFIIGSLLIAALYLGKDIFIPLALAILLAFLVDPLVMQLRGWGLPQMPSIFIVVGLALAILSGAASYLGYQLGQLSQELPQYHGYYSKENGFYSSICTRPECLGWRKNHHRYC